MNNRQLARKLGRGWITILGLLFFNLLFAGQQATNQSDFNSRIQVQINQSEIQPCSLGNSLLCAINLNFPVICYGQLTITNTSNSTISNIDITIENSTIYSLLNIENSCFNLSLNHGDSCIISMTQIENAPSPASELVNIIGNINGSSIVLGQFQLSLSP